MARKYNLSLIFYPQPEGGYGVVCPEIKGCFSEGETIADATANIRRLIADFLPDEIKTEAQEEIFRRGCCMKGKMFQDIEVTVDAGEVIFPPSAEKIERVAV
jgi:predicted RNase H-like HicB family nuclease